MTIFFILFCALFLSPFVLLLIFNPGNTYQSGLEDYIELAPTDFENDPRTLAEGEIEELERVWKLS